eukprot:4601282-Pyramimonas_sp.AAC.1
MQEVRVYSHDGPIGHRRGVAVAVGASYLDPGCEGGGQMQGPEDVDGQQMRVQPAAAQWNSCNPVRPRPTATLGQ